MKIVALSDTHGEHRQLHGIPEGDVLVFAGDMTKTGRVLEVVDFANWFGRFPHKYKIVVAGNHDFCFAGNQRQEAIEALEDEGIVYLEDDYITVQDKLFYGSPRSATFDNYVFKSEDFEWDISNQTDVLITHGPPKGTGDYAEGYGHVGCEKLKEAVNRHEIVSGLEAHIFGHIHEQYGNIELNKYNVSLLDKDYELVNRPVVIQLER